jgi:hypothetical protein
VRSRGPQQPVTKAGHADLLNVAHLLGVPADEAIVILESSCHTSPDPGARQAPVVQRDDWPAGRRRRQSAPVSSPSWQAPLSPPPA